MRTAIWYRLPKLACVLCVCVFLCVHQHQRQVRVKHPWCAWHFFFLFFYLFCYGSVSRCPLFVCLFVFVCANQRWIKVWSCGFLTRICSSNSDEFVSERWTTMFGVGGRNFCYSVSAQCEWTAATAVCLWTLCVCVGTVQWIFFLLCLSDFARLSFIVALGIFDYEKCRQCTMREWWKNGRVPA